MEILLADDDQWVLLALSDCVREIFPEAQIDLFKDGIAAWEAAKNKKYDLVITDLTMIQMHGDELAKRIHQKDPETHILFETSAIEYELHKLGIQTERCIYKPFDTMSIRRKVERLQNLPPFEILSPG